jgi:hypothetical protein
VPFLQHFVKKRAPKGRFWILVIEPVTSIRLASPSLT